MSEQLDGLSMNIEETNKDKLKQVFPECFTEGKLDIDKLLSLCGEYMTDDFERYEFKWKGKSECLQLAQRRSAGTLRPCVEESVNWENTKNLYIEGDNLEVLKLLQRTYYHKVKMIYIDPPYNTGNDFVYEDDFKDPLERYREVTSQTTKSNPETMGRFHTSWLNMMYPRLRLAANLLREDGVCFISIDEIEMPNLRKICDEVFGEENHVADFVWHNKRGGGNDAKYVAVEHEYVVMYAKSVSNLERLFVPYSPSYIGRYKESDSLGKFFWDTFKRKSGKQYYSITCPDGTILEKDELGNPISWLRSESRFYEDLQNGEVRIIKVKDKWSVQFKQRLPEGKKPRTIFLEESIFEKQGTTGDGSSEILEIFKKNTFNNPKSLSLIKYILTFNTVEEDIILDFFSGSATTAHAVMQLNAEDGGNRQFIMVQLPEVCDEKTEAYKAGYKNICEIGKERIRRAGRKILEVWKEKQKQISLEERRQEEKQKQISLAEQWREEAQKQISLIEENQEEAQKQGPIAEQKEEEKPKDEQKPTSPDIGFRVFKLDTSNCKIWDNSPVSEDNLIPLEERLKSMTERIKPDRVALDMVFEIMLKLGIPLTDQVIPMDFSGKRAYSIWENCLVLVCLEKDVTLKQLEEMADYAPAQMVFAQDSFDGSVGKVNAEMTLQRYGITLKFL